MTIQELRGIDRLVLFMAALVVFFSGLYFVGPWYIEQSSPTGATLFDVLQGKEVVNFVGLFYLTTGMGLGYTVLRQNVQLKYALRLLLAAIVLRVFTLSGVLFTRDSLLPPSYLSNIAMVVICGGYWLYLKGLIRARVD